jgi:hypothetical protein
MWLRAGAGAWPAVLAVGVLLLFVGGAAIDTRAAGEDEFEVVEDASEVFKGADENGESWAISRTSGRLERGDEGFFNEAASLKVNGSGFEAEEVLRASGAPHWRLTGKVGVIAVRRDIYFDAKRGGVRYLETFTNSGDEDVSVDVEYGNRFRYQWRKLHTAEGRDFDGKLGVRDTGLYVQMSEEAQHRGGLFLLCGERSAHKPGIEMRDRNTLTVRYTLSIAPKQSRSLTQWIALRRLTDPEEIKGLTMKYAAAAVRMPNGNTLISLYKGSHLFVEITADKKIVWGFKSDVVKGIAGATSIQYLD